MRHWLAVIGEHAVQLWYWIRATIGGAKVDMTQVHPQVWTGGAITTDADVAAVAAAGITADIDCREEFNDQSLVDGFNNLPPTPGSIKTHPRIAYYYAGVADDGQPKPASWFEGAWRFAEPILSQGGVVYAHCAAGHNRGPSMAYFLLRAYFRLSPQDAHTAIVQARPVASMAYAGDADRAITALGLG